MSRRLDISGWARKAMTQQQRAEIVAEAVRLGVYVNVQGTPNGTWFANVWGRGLAPIRGTSTHDPAAAVFAALAMVPEEAVA
jgi:hypothetical protein